MNKLRKSLIMIILVIMTFVIIPINVDAATPKLNKKKVTLYVGQNTILKVSGVKDVTWKSSNNKIVTVKNGKITAKKKGNAIITAKASGKTYKCKVTIKNPTLNKTKVTLNKGKTTTLKLTGSAVNSWSSSNTKIATINKKGIVTAKKAGTTTIKAKAKNGKTYKCKVIVKEPHTHKYQESITKTATCLKDGTITYKCSCGDKYYKTIPKTDHNFNKGVITTQATCFKDGIKTFTCKNCRTTKNEKINKLTHNKSNWIIDKDATCIENGNKHKECTICQFILETKEIKAKGHFYKDAIVEPTCIEKGYTKHICSICKNSYIDNYKNTIDHISSNWIIDKNATCTENGNKHKECINCQSILKVEEIEILDHNIINGKCSNCDYEEIEEHTHKYDIKITKEATCKENGIITYICECGNSYTKLIEKKDHISSNWIIDKNATCTENGNKHKECINCQSILEVEEIITQGHSYVNTIILPTCIAEGYTIYECSSCGNNYKQDIVPTIEHSWGEWITIKEATEIGTGEHKHICVVCEIEEKEEIPMLEHIHKYEQINIVEPTCTTNGYITYACACGTNYNSDFVDALNHNIPNEWSIIEEPTCVKNGWKEIKCTRCDYIQNGESIDALGHCYDNGTIITQATCTIDGEILYTCGSCEKTKIEPIKSIGHTYGHFVETLTPIDFKTFGSANMVCPTCEEVLFLNLTAVKVDLGNGNSETMYGYYDYDEAKICFDLTYDYVVKTNTINKKRGLTWNEESYNFACIRTAEMSIIANQSNKFDGPNYHTRPNGESFDYGENMTATISTNKELILELNAQQAFDRWITSSDHKDNIEGGYSKLVCAKFKVWLPKWNCWAIFWVQDF